MVARAETFARGCGASLEATEKWMAIYFLVGPLIRDQGVIVAITTFAGSYG